MPIPLIAYLGAAGLGAYLLLRPKPAIQPREAGVAVPPPPLQPPPAAGQPIPAGMAQLGSGALAQVIPVGNSGFTAASDPDLVGAFQSGDIVPGVCFTVDIGAAGIQVEGVPSGNILFRCTDGMIGTNAVKGVPIDPRLPAGQPETVVPLRSVTGAGVCE